MIAVLQASKHVLIMRIAIIVTVQISSSVNYCKRIYTLKHFRHWANRSSWSPSRKQVWIKNHVICMHLSYKFSEYIPYRSNCSICNHL